MIYYFSGTGNSLFIARHLSQQLHCILKPMATAEHIHTDVTGVLGFVFPVYGWHLPKIVEHFLYNFSFSQKRPTYIFAILTCGDDIGQSHKLLHNTLRRKGITLNAVWSVKMPNTYVALPGFDIDSVTLQQRKIEAVQLRLNRVVSAINRRESPIIDVHPGLFSYTKTYILGYLFNRFLTKHKYFKSEHTCIGCRKCERICPIGNIKCDIQGRPSWQNDCTLCLACYHNCPTHSINYGPFTFNKGQYICKKS